METLSLIYFIGYVYILILYTVIYAQNTREDYYIGAVVDYAPKHNPTLSPGANIQNNINEYETFVKQAKEKEADIIVFPECGLTTTRYEHDLQLYTSILPDPKNKIVACGTNSNWSKVIERLSCAAKNNGIYVVVNLPERMMLDSSDNTQDNKYEIFNSNIVFDRNGALIARYRKYNLFGERGFNVTESPDLTFFETDFNVTFGTFICFDILFAKPSLDLLLQSENITDIVYPTAWFSELPFLTAVQTQVGWARANGVNFLGAAYSSPTHFGGGSTIYQASGDIAYVIPVQNVSNLIVRKIKKITKRVSPKDIKTSKATNIVTNNIPNLKLETFKEDMSKYTTKILNGTETDYELCHDSFCCTFTVKFDQQQPEVDYYYRMVVYYGPRRFAMSKNNVQICGLAACKNATQESCGERIENPSNSKKFILISIKGEFIDEGSSVIFPTNVLYDLGVLAPSNFSFKTIMNDCSRTVEMKTKTNVSKILGFGIYSVTKDSPSNAARALSGAVIALIVISVLIILALIGLFIWRRYKRHFIFVHSSIN